jgi:hypothetical protein
VTQHTCVAVVHDAPPHARVPPPEPPLLLPLDPPLELPLLDDDPPSGWLPLELPAPLLLLLDAPLLEVLPPLEPPLLEPLAPLLLPVASLPPSPLPPSPVPPPLVLFAPPHATAAIPMASNTHHRPFFM